MKKFVIIVLCVAVLSINLSVVSFADDDIVGQPPYYPLNDLSQSSFSLPSLGSFNFSVFYDDDDYPTASSGTLTSDDPRAQYLSSYLSFYCSCSFDGWSFQGDFTENGYLFLSPLSSIPTDPSLQGGFNIDFDKSGNIFTFYGIRNDSITTDFSNKYWCWSGGGPYFQAYYNGVGYKLKYAGWSSDLVSVDKASIYNVTSRYWKDIRILSGSSYASLVPDDKDCCAQLSARVDDLEEKLNATSSSVENMQNELNNFFRFLVAVL